MHAPRMPAMHPSYKAPTFKAPKMPHAAAPARANGTSGRTKINKGQTHTSTPQVHATNTQARNVHAATTGTSSNHNKTMSTVTPNRHAANANTGTSTNTNTTGTVSPTGYTYGTGSNMRHYRPYGYGHGYRNHYYGGRRGYGSSQANSRAVVARLRAVHHGLSRIDHDYQGHRVRAMHQVSMAIRALTHRSMIYRNGGFANGMNTNLVAANQRLLNRRNVAGAGNARRHQRMPQGMSDARMSQALRTLQGVSMQLSTQGTNTSRHGRALGHVHYAMNELNTALTVR
jgi:hypothetical protein